MKPIMKPKLAIKDINFDLIKEILEKIYDCKISGQDTTFDEIWKENFIDKFNDESCAKNSGTNEYKDPIVKIIFSKCKSFFESGCIEIINSVTDIENKIKEIQEEK